MASRILVIDASATMRMLLSSLLAASQYTPLIAADLPEAVRLARKAPPHAILVGIGDRDPENVLDVLRARGLMQQKSRVSPVVCLDQKMTPERRLKALQSGARDLIHWPLDERLLLARLRGILREVHSDREIVRRESAAIRFGFAEDTSTFGSSGTVAFVAEGHSPNQIVDQMEDALRERFFQISPEEALGAGIEPDAYDVVILDGNSLDRPKLLGTLPELRSREHSRHSSILVVHPEEDAAGAIFALDSGASDIVAGDALGGEVLHRVKSLLRRKAFDDALRLTSENSMRLAATDALTGLFNRRYALTYLADAIKASHASEQPFTIMMVDIDHFKKINDDHGHASGDLVLQEVAERMRSNMRSIDLVARFGGEEFLIVLPETDERHANLAANRLLTRISATPITISDSIQIDVTVSIGVTVGDAKCVERAIDGFGADASPDSSMHKLIGAADSALYTAKAGGRDRVELVSSSV